MRPHQLQSTTVKRAFCSQGTASIQDDSTWRTHPRLLAALRLVDFTHGKIVTHVLGNHIEQTRTPYLDYPIRSVYQPDEHQLELGRAHLLELNEALHDMNGKITRM